MPRGCPCGSCRNHSLHIQNDSGNAGRGPSGGSSWMVSWGDSLWESPGESAGGSPQGDSLGGGIPGEEGTGGGGRGEGCQGHVPAVPVETTAYKYRRTL
jgi:hypothetical protein